MHQSARRPSALRASGSTWAWRKTRLRILARDRRICQYCGAKGANTVDHKLPRSMGGGDEDSNLVACCGRCQNATDRTATPGPSAKPSGSLVITKDYSRRRTT